MTESNKFNNKIKDLLKKKVFFLKICFHIEYYIFWLLHNFFSKHFKRNKKIPINDFLNLFFNWKSIDNRPKELIQKLCKSNYFLIDYLKLTSFHEKIIIFKNLKNIHKKNILQNYYDKKINYNYVIYFFNEIRLFRNLLCHTLSFDSKNFYKSIRTLRNCPIFSDEIYKHKNRNVEQYIIFLEIINSIYNINFVQKKFREYMK